MSFSATPITLVGRVVTDIETRVIPSGVKVANFRLMSQERVYDKEQGQWTDGDRMYLKVACWRKLADNAAESLRKGDQVVVHGRMKIRKYTSEDGTQHEALEVDARALGPDLALHTAQVNRMDWAVSPNQQRLVDPPPVQLVHEDLDDHPLTRQEVAEAA